MGSFPCQLLPCFPFILTCFVSDVNYYTANIIVPPQAIYFTGNKVPVLTVTSGSLGTGLTYPICVHVLADWYWYLPVYFGLGSAQKTNLPKRLGTGIIASHKPVNHGLCQIPVIKRQWLRSRRREFKKFCPKIPVPGLRGGTGTVPHVLNK